MALTLQLVGGAILVIVVQFALIYAVFGYVTPWMGLELLDMDWDTVTEEWFEDLGFP